MQVAGFGSVAAFLAEPRKSHQLPAAGRAHAGVSGLDFQAELNREGVALPIIFMTGHGDIPMSVRAMKAGAVDFLAKPFRDQDLLDAIHAALAADRERRQRDQARHGITARYATLTPREREIMALAARPDEQADRRRGGHQRNHGQIHRGNAMRKMQAKTFADLVRMAEALGLA
jgi:FixJ family two-component response regulator